MAIRDPRPYMRAYIGQPYCYGFRGWSVNQSNVQAKKKQYPGMSNGIPCEGPVNGSKVGTDCIGAICAACSIPDIKSLIMGYTKTGMGYYPAKDGKKGNGFMDAVSANGAYMAWGAKKITGRNVPEPTAEKPGVVVFIYEPGKSVGHIGMYMGNGVVCESTPPRVQETQLYARKTSKGDTKQWTHWAYIPNSWLTWADSYHGTAHSKPAEKPTAAPANALQVGDRVRVRAGSKEWHPGTKMPGWAPGQEYTVVQVLYHGEPLKKGGMPCVLLGGVNTWCATNNLEKARDA